MRFRGSRIAKVEKQGRETTKQFSIQPLFSFPGLLHLQFFFYNFQYAKKEEEGLGI